MHLAHSWHKEGSADDDPAPLLCTAEMARVRLEAPDGQGLGATPPVPLVPVCSQMPSSPFPALLGPAGNSISQAWQQALGCFLLVGGLMGDWKVERRRQGDSPSLLPSSVFGLL